MPDLKYPIGRFKHEGPITSEQRERWIDEIESLPTMLLKALADLSDEQLDTPYRPDGWTVRQVVHHIGDSHLNSFARFKLALTEEQPAIKPYYEERWAILPDASDAPVQLSTSLISGLHARWAYFLRAMTETDYAKTFFHPSSQRISRLDETLGLYAWHGRHHVAHITSLRERMGW
ncbi:YfiT family bacillithiol transferase [Cohnella endophytica]|uniref:YfiT family bacillithiol transferase n=1 Tax=Cohnella endophytica TaxID=2419778 RepID=UPI002D786CC7|nr:bacillithiol transferase BstA [Cohnella endophytica]